MFASSRTCSFGAPLGRGARRQCFTNQLLSCALHPFKTSVSSQTLASNSSAKPTGPAAPPSSDPFGACQPCEKCGLATTQRPTRAGRIDVPGTSKENYTNSHANRTQHARFPKLSTQIHRPAPRRTPAFIQNAKAATQNSSTAPSPSTSSTIPPQNGHITAQSQQRCRPSPRPPGTTTSRHVHKNIPRGQLHVDAGKNRVAGCRNVLGRPAMSVGVKYDHYPG